VANPVSAWWKKQNDAWSKRRRWIIAGVVAVILLWAWSSGGGRMHAKSAAIPSGYTSAGRQLLVQVDSKASKPMPLVIVLHDDPSAVASEDFSTADKVRRASDLEKLGGSHSDRFAVAYAESVASAWRVGDPRDEQYIRDILGYIADKRTKVDLHRVYLWGTGEGGRMALDVACSTTAAGQPQVFAAVAVLGQNAQPANCPATSVRQWDTLKWNADLSKQMWDFSRTHRLT
jgi:polyhydroxybutyrate depolymerase